MKDKQKAVTNKNVEDKCFENLQELLLLAVKLELFTIPVYLYTYYSLKNLKSRVGVHLREVIMEEMLHMAIMSNIMHAIEKCKPPAYSPIREPKGTPCTKKLADLYVPFYPNTAPIYKSDAEINDHRRFATDVPIFSLDSLSREQIVAFLRLELPELRKDTDADRNHEDWKTIGEFYNHIKKQLLRCPNLKFGPLNQIDLYTHNPTKERNPLRPIQDLKVALESIDFIVEQGEGATFYNLIKHHENYRNFYEKYSDLNNAVGEDDVQTPELAHFFRFLIVYKLMGGKEEFSIDTESFDEELFIKNYDEVIYNNFRMKHVINLVKDPSKKLGSYPPKALEANRLFNINYSSLLDRLTYASLDDHRLNFGIALEQMTNFDELARAVTAFTLTNDETTYCGPTFEYVCPKDRI